MHHRFTAYVLGMLVFCSGIVAGMETEKTFLLPQPLRLPTTLTTYRHLFDLRVRNRKAENGHFQVSYVYARTTNGAGIGRYFGRNGRNKISIGSAPTDFQVANFIFTDNPSALKLKGTITLLPVRRVKGICVNYIQRLSTISKDLFLQISVPSLQATHSLRARVCDEQTDMVEGRKVSVLDYFVGQLEQKEDPFKQAPLRFAKMSCCTLHSKSEIADIEALLSYQFNECESYYVRPFVGLVIPTSSRPEACCLFEPLLGNCGRWGVVGGVELMGIVYGAGETSVDLIGSCAIKQFFTNRQRRTLGFRSDDWSSVKAWSHYELLGEAGKKGVFPAANVLTRDVRVSKGLIFDCTLNCHIRHRRCVTNLGYNFFARTPESLRVVCWPENRYALASSQYNTSKPFVIVDDPNPLVDDNLEGPITQAMLNEAAPATPAGHSHKVYGMISYMRNSIPLSIGIGGSYEFASENSVLQGYELYGKIGFSF